jgi:putative ABC transport system permease protein
VGYGLGIGLAALFGRATRGTELAFRMLPQLLAISGAAVIVICVLASVISIVKVMRLEPAIVFKS